MKIGSDFDDFLREERLLEVSEATAAKRVIAFQGGLCMQEPPTSTKVPVRLQERLTPEEREAMLQRLRQRFAHIPAGVSLADELISERRAESKREEA